MGVGPVEKQRLGSSAPGYGFSGGRDGVSSVKVKKERTDEDYEEESKRVLKMLQASGDIDEDMDSEAGVMPVQLPLSFHALRAKDKEAESVALGADIKVKGEPTDVDMVDAEDTKTVETLKKPVKQVAVKEETTSEDTVFKLLSTQSVGEQKLLFFQFPDVLPIKPVSNDQGDTMPVDEASNEQPSAEEEKGPKQQKNLSFKDASEGYIGKLQLLKSGKARLLLGDVSLDVTMGTPCGFLQDVVSVHTEDNRSEMICLGHVKQRLICTPDFEHLLASS